MEDYTDIINLETIIKSHITPSNAIIKKTIPKAIKLFYDFKNLYTNSLKNAKIKTFQIPTFTR